MFMKLFMNFHLKMFYMNSFHDKADNIDGHEDDDDEDEQ